MRKSVDDVVGWCLLDSATAAVKEDEAVSEDDDDVVFGFVTPPDEDLDDPLNFNLPPTATRLFATSGLELLL